MGNNAASVAVGLPLRYAGRRLTTEVSMRIVLAAIAALFLLPAAAQAQGQKFSPKAGPTEEQRAKAAEKAAQERDTEERYRASMKQIPDNKQPVDPWAGVRTPGK